jgi:hypothetical protein
MNTLMLYYCLVHMLSLQKSIINNRDNIFKNKLYFQFHNQVMTLESIIS